MLRDEDAVWMRRIHEQGDEAAFTKVYQKHAPLVLGVALRLLKDQQEAEEILQKVFLHVWERAADFDPARGKLPVWLAILSRSRSLDRLRSRQRRLTHEFPFAELPERSKPGQVNALGELEAEQQRKLLKEALESLRPVQAEALRGAYFEGLSGHEIAQRMGLPLGTVKTHLFRGLAGLLKFLQGRQEGPQ